MNIANNRTINKINIYYLDLYLTVKKLDPI